MLCSSLLKLANTALRVVTGVLKKQRSGGAHLVLWCIYNWLNEKSSCHLYQSINDSGGSKASLDHIEDKNAKENL